MPPNRKNNVLEVLVPPAMGASAFVTTSKFPPLTTTTPVAPLKGVPAVAPNQQQQQQQQQQQHAAEPTKPESRPVQQQRASHVRDPFHPANAYWDWPTTTSSDEKEAIIDGILQQEKVRQMLSIDHVEANLLAESERRRKEDCASKAIKENDAYWYEPTEEERAAELVSANHVEAKLRLLAVAAPSPKASSAAVVAPHVKDASSHPAQSYWDWPATTPETDKQSLIRSILEQEKVRQLFQVDHVESLLTQQQQQQPQQQHAAALNPANDSYWEQ